MGSPARKRRGWRPPVPLIAALVGAAAGFAFFLVERDSGGGDLSPAARHLIAQADEICAESRGIYNRASAHPPQDTKQAARQAARLAEISGQALAEMRRLNPPPELAAKWRGYLALRAIQVRHLQLASNAARQNNVNAYEAQFRKISAGASRRADAAGAIGLHQCSRAG